MTAQAFDAKYCPACAHGRHGSCRVDRCECAEQRHRPDDRVAAAMTVYQRLDLRGTDRAALATAWRKHYRAPEET